MTSEVKRVSQPRIFKSTTERDNYGTKSQFLGKLKTNILLSNACDASLPDSEKIIMLIT